MRVIGSAVPNTFDIYQYGDKCELRLRENIAQIENNEYVYDEYSIKGLLYNSSLEEDVQTRISSWLATAKELERIPASSELYHLEEEHTNELATLVEMIYQDDLEVIG